MESTAVTPTPTSSGQLRRVLRAPTLTLLGLNGALGSAVLFGVAGITASAGPAGIISMLIGAVLFVPLALNQLELARTFPEAGAPGRYPLYTHGHFTNLINVFASLVWYVFISPFEAFAIITGLNQYVPHLISASGAPTYQGALLGVAITLLFVPFNYFGSHIMGRSNFVAGLAKVCLYGALGIGLLVIASHTRNLTGFDGFTPLGADGILASLPTVMFTYASARILADYSEEVESVGVLRKAFIGLVAGQLVGYVLFEYVFVTGINWHALGLAPGAWTSLSKVTSNPFILLATNSHGGALITIAIIMGIGLPFLTGFVYLGGGARVLVASSRAGYVNKYLAQINPKNDNPTYAVITFAVMGAILAFVAAPVHSIFKIIDDALVGGYLGYAFSAVSMAAARRQDLTKQRIPFGDVIAAAAFAIGGLVVYWSGWPSVPYAFAIITGATIVFSYAFKVKRHFKHALWAIAYMAFLLVMVWIGSVGELSLVSFNLSSLIVAVVSLAIFYPAGILSALKPAAAHAIWAEAHQEHARGEGQAP